MASSSAAPPAAAQGAGIRRACTYNIGGTSTFGDRTEKKFKEKLDEDLRAMVAHGADVIFLQEVNPQWDDRIQETLVGWRSFKSTIALVVILVKDWEHGWQLLGEEEKNVFPDAEDRKSAHRSWRTFLTVKVRAPDGKEWLLANAHTVSGSAAIKHNIPGKKPQQREMFKAVALSNMVRQWRGEAADRSSGATLGFLLAGDLNMSQKAIVKAVENDPIRLARAVDGGDQSAEARQGSSRL